MSTVTSEDRATTPTTGRGPRVVIVGAGFSGIAMGIALKRAGIDDFTIYDRADDLGGVWHHNTYPGAACDIPSSLYSYSFEIRRDWSRPCSPHGEIKDYLRHCVRKYGLTEHLRTGVEIADARWDEATATWTVRTAAGETIEADAVVLGCGQLSRPAWPRIPGRERFAGHSFHSAEWDHDYDLRGKRVAVIGTGASAVQFVPPVAAEVDRLDVYQRSPSYMLPRRNNAYAPWARAVIEKIPPVQAVRRRFMYDFTEIATLGLTSIPPLGLGLKAWSKWFFLRSVKDPELRRKLTPDYPIGCKRILFSSAFYPALARDNVELVVDEIREITERGIVTADGTEREVDAIVYATGFQTQSFVAPIAVHGTDGVGLEQAWKAGADAHLGIAVAGFPNMFLLYGPNTNLSVGSIIVMIEAQVGYVQQALEHLRTGGAAAIDVRPEAQAASSGRVQRRFEGSVWTRCDSWYRNEQGRVVNNWPYRMRVYEQATAEFRPGEYREIRVAAPAAVGDAVSEAAEAGEGVAR